MKAAPKGFKEGYNETEAEIITKNGDRKLYYLNGSSVFTRENFIARDRY
jgi:hypothetical protein